jgi:hypothetical protein
MKFVDFIKTPIGTFIVISLAIIVILALLILLIYILGKHGKLINLNIGSKKGDNNKQRATVNMSIDNLTQLLCSHKFFSSVKYEFVEKDYEFTFSLYDTLLDHGIKTETEIMVEFKKSLANKFLSDCLFKYLNESTKTWIKSILTEYSKASESDVVKENYMPESMCDIIENLVHFSKETKHLAENLRFSFRNKTINGIPVEFVDCFCKTVNKSIVSIQQLFSSIIYTANNSWVEKVIEILDIYELALDYIKNSVDSTLVIMNGQIKKYVDKQFGEDKLI